jgi:hypothetical protein
MPTFPFAVRAAAAAAALAAGSTAGLATAAQASADSHSSRVERVAKNQRNAKARRHLTSSVKTESPRVAVANEWRRRHRDPTPTTPTTTTTKTTTSTTPTTTTPTTTGTPTTTTTTTPTTTTPTTTTPPTTSSTGTADPTGVSGNWGLVFDDEFNGTAINTNVWNTHDGWTNQNNVTDHASNVTESGGDAILTLASSTSGATIGTNQNVLAVGDFAEARVEFAGSGTSIYNWPAWWASGPNWPAAGENDIAEGLGTLTVNYHSPSGAHNQGTIPGSWANSFHTYGIYRGPNYCDVYWDGQLVKQYSTDDNGAAQELLFTMGASNTLQFGAAGQMKVDYVRVWSAG